MKEHILEKWKDLSSQSKPADPELAKSYFFAGAVAAVTTIDNAAMATDMEWSTVTEDIYLECKAWVEREEAKDGIQAI